MHELSPFKDNTDKKVEGKKKQDYKEDSFPQVFNGKSNKENTFFSFKVKIIQKEKWELIMIFKAQYRKLFLLQFFFFQKRMSSYPLFGNTF